MTSQPSSTKCNLSLTWLGVVDDVRSAHAGAGAHRRCRGALGLDMEPGAVLDKLQTLLLVNSSDSDV